MYEVFANDHRLFLTSEIAKETDFKLFLMDTVDLEDVVSQLQKGKIQGAQIYHPKKKDLLKKFTKKAPLVVAAGGLVQNKQGETLFIFRNGKWDLPKGKVDKGESIEEAAIREVAEETGAKKLKLGDLLGVTYHLFKRNGVIKLKETHWYKMSTKYKGELIPQCDEGIEKAVWLSDDQIEEALSNSYANIKGFFERVTVSE
ncbi:NUDIX hydrolase [Robertkochia aurantiaca]|uniref:NUDIX hydrolase n=1 Tax=Robertkochia aurantiaca TaxID=2873700 RepID=UPI00272C4896|nr:NUDIX domain-containing protein [Robertkochia sp. 3YJGBD-33]